MIFQVGDKYEETFVIANEVYSGFINTFNDTNPLHTDQSFAVAKGFTGIVMHGNILNGFLSYFVGECLPSKNVIIHSQSIQFKHPVYLCDVLVFEAEIIGLYESVNAVEFKFNYRNSSLKVVAKGLIQIGILI